MENKPCVHIVILHLVFYLQRILVLAAARAPTNQSAKQYLLFLAAARVATC